jgi:energy-coupling factor transporter ATP-binding protein EcfA2
VSTGAVRVAGSLVVRIENLYDVAGSGKSPTPGLIPPCPYPGLAYFGPNDASRFFGREQAIQALVAAVTKRSFTALVGASGCGKSSVVLAGLAPRLDAQGDWRSSYFRVGTEPDRNPFAAIARALAPLLGPADFIGQMSLAQKLTAGLESGTISLSSVLADCSRANGARRILLISDQFEEIFTLVLSEEVRIRFIEILVDAFRDPDLGRVPNVHLVLTLRADFYNSALRYRPLADRFQDCVENLGPMTREELREAIVKPADAVSVGFEPGLVDTILDDVAQRAGSLPLMQFALREMWARLHIPLIAHTDYHAIGGVEGALAQRAQAVFEHATQGEKDAAMVSAFGKLQKSLRPSDDRIYDACGELIRLLKGAPCTPLLASMWARELCLSTSDRNIKNVAELMDSYIRQILRPAAKNDQDLVRRLTMDAITIAQQELGQRFSPGFLTRDDAIDIVKTMDASDFKQRFSVLEDSRILEAPSPTSNLVRIAPDPIAEHLVARAEVSQLVGEENWSIFLETLMSAGAPAGFLAALLACSEHEVYGKNIPASVRDRISVMSASGTAAKVKL